MLAEANRVILDSNEHLHATYRYVGSSDLPRRLRDDGSSGHSVMANTDCVTRFDVGACEIAAWFLCPSISPAFSFVLTSL
jgi:hypothetical protein